MEVELKYRARDDGVLDRLEAIPELGPALLGPAAAFGEVDRYLDTADGRLSAAGWACRLRTRGRRTIVSLKGPSDGPRRADPAALHRRPELEGPALAPTTPAAVDPLSWPASEARSRLLALSDGHLLVERLRLDQERSERAVLVEERRIGVLSLDRVEVRAASRVIGRLLAVELELEDTAAGETDGELAVVADFDAALRAVDGLEPDPRTKLEHALAMSLEAR